VSFQLPLFHFSSSSNSPNLNPSFSQTNSFPCLPTLSPSFFLEFSKNKNLVLSPAFLHSQSSSLSLPKLPSPHLLLSLWLLLCLFSPSLHPNFKVPSYLPLSNFHFLSLALFLSNCQSVFQTLTSSFLFKALSPPASPSHSFSFSHSPSNFLGSTTSFYLPFPLTFSLSFTLSRYLTKIFQVTTTFPTSSLSPSHSVSLHLPHIFQVSLFLSNSHIHFLYFPLFPSQFPSNFPDPPLFLLPKPHFLPLTPFHHFPLPHTLKFSKS